MKGKKTDLGDVHCGIARSLSIIGDWWSLLIVRDALRGMGRFGEFQKSLGLAKNILSARLKKLVEHGILRTEPDSDGSPYKRYVLTSKGEELGVVMVSLWQWGAAHCFAPGELARTLVARDSGEPLAPLTLRTQTGRELAPSNYGTAALPAMQGQA